MWPELVRIPGTTGAIPTYGVLVACGIVAGLVVTVALATRDGFDPVRVYRVGVLAVAAAVAGTWLMWLVDEALPSGGASLTPAGLAGGGRVFYGGLLAGLAATVALARASGWESLRFLDAAAPGVALGQAFGRVGCFAAGCCWGRECALPWGIAYPFPASGHSGPPAGIPLHPVQLYEAAFALALSVALVRLFGRRGFAGQVALAYLVLYPAARFVVEFWRGDERGDLVGLTAATGLSPAQLISLALVAAAGAALAIRRARPACSARRPPNAGTYPEATLDRPGSGPGS